ncbi:FixH family protein [Bacillus badius]|uniref:FixH family protein n=1 Tax=Bacillus badius TaxID=1455 RepID=UPI000596B91A|nr:FixH family protein [Bacillus badius]KIL76146.1 yznA protein [Bacillus badius]
MRKLFWTITFVLALAALAACSNETTKEAEEPKKSLQPLKAELDIPDTIAVNEKVQLKAAVSQGDEKVADARKVQFEIWEEDKKEDSQMIKAENNKDGTYTAETTFDRDGLFTVQVHVDARDLHTMPLKKVTVGKGAAEGQQAAHEEYAADEHSHGEKPKDEHGHGEHAKGFSMHFAKPEHVKANADTSLTVHLQMDESPLEKAQVRYEIWNAKTEDKHAWADAKEAKPGEYTGSYTFPDAGEFTVVVHVENKDGLHEHEEHQLAVAK